MSKSAHHRPPAAELCSTQQQPFDSEMLGGRVGRLEIPAALADASDALAAKMPELATGWRSEGYWLVSCRLPEPDTDRPPIAETVLQAAGFQPVETLVTLAHALADVPDVANSNVAVGKQDDAEMCATIGAEALVSSRYNADPRIDPLRAAALKAQWVRNAFAGRADAIYCTHAGGQVTGFNLLLSRGEDAIIDLIAVAPSAQRRGYGRQLVQAGLAHYAARAKRMLVGTQAVNTASLALYLALGFVELHRTRTYHWMASDA